MEWYDGLGAAVQDVLRELDWESLLYDRPRPEITSRAKTIDTLRDKLRRTPNRPLSSVQDVAGVRFECMMTLEEQDVVASAIAAAFDHGPKSVKDLRAEPHWGYRAVHVWLRLPQGHVEVQVRTHLQGAWANAYEALADVLGRGIRYGERSVYSHPDIDKMVADFQELSTVAVVAAEELRQQRASLQMQVMQAHGLPRDGHEAEVIAAFNEAWADHEAREAEVVTRLREMEATIRRLQRREVS